MTLYIVKAKPRKDLDYGKRSKLTPFWEELHHGLDSARIENDTRTGSKKTIAGRHWRWRGEACWIAISTTSQSSW